MSSPVVQQAQRAHRPRVSVVIASKNRPDFVAKLIASLRRQSWSDLEIVVVDDASDPPLPDLGVNQHLRNEISAGCSAAHNRGILATQGDYVFVFDDDVELQRFDFIEAAIGAAGEIPQLGAMAFPQLKSDGQPHWMQPSQSAERVEVATFFGYAVLFRREALSIAGLYFEPLQFYFDENELSLRLIDKGFRVVYEPSLPVTHHEDARGRNFRLIHRLCWRNVLFTAVARHPYWLLPASIGLATYRWMRLAKNWKHFQWNDLFWGFSELGRLWPSLLRERAPVRWSTLSAVRSLQRNPRSLAG